jgi:DNA-binding CsgD family transcriptional regulator
VLSAAVVRSLEPHAVDRSAQLARRLRGARPAHGERLLFAQAAMYSVVSAEPRPKVGELAERAWDGGLLLERGDPGGLGWTMVVAALTMCGELERSLEISEAVLAGARRRSSPAALAHASFARGLPQLWQGNVAAAIADLEIARDRGRYGWRRFGRAAAADHALCLIEAGELDRAADVLDADGPLTEPPDIEDARRLYACAELRRAQGRAREALALALASGKVVERHVQVFALCPWRITAAEAALALGERSRALALAREAFELAERSDVPHARIAAGRLLGRCEPDPAGLEHLQAAVALGETVPPRLATIRALVDLGAAMRRANQRTAARIPLQRAADVAQRGGALAPYERARTELAATGARPRRDAVLSGPGSLTPSERRIAELAAGGQTNRQIAQLLFVTPKTVEYHLRNAYRKLEIETRQELRRVL